MKNEKETTIGRGMEREKIGVKLNKKKLFQMALRNC